MNTKHIIFDFDGTIADTIDMALNTFNRFSEEFNLEPLSIDDLELIRANRPQELLKSFGVTKIRLTSILLRLRKEMSRSVAEIILIQGMSGSLNAIREAGYRLGVLTSNSQENVAAFLKNNQLTDLFDFIYSGQNLFGKEKLIKRMLKREKISKENVIYIGDETRDVEACKKAGIPVIAVSWGLNSRELLEAVQPDHIIDTPEELLPGIKQIFEKR